MSRTGWLVAHREVRLVASLIVGQGRKSWLGVAAQSKID